MKKLLNMLLVLAIVITCINIPVKASDDNGIWVLRNHHTEIIKGTSSTGGWWYDNLDYDYDESKGEVTHFITVHLSNVNGIFECNTYAKCSIPPTTITAGQKVFLDQFSYVSGNSLDGMLCDNVSYVTIKGYSLWWRDVNDYSHSWITSKLGPNYKQRDSAKTFNSLGKGEKFGDTCTIQFTQHCGVEINTYWEYEWVRK